MEMNKTLGLSMIVKNEAHVIKRLLNSVIHHLFLSRNLHNKGIVLCP